MRTILNRYTTVAGALVLAGAMVGCEAFEGETAGADRRTSVHIEDGTRHRDSAADDAHTAALLEFERAAAETSASPAMRAHAKALLAQTHQEVAQQLLRETHPWQNDAARLIWEASQIANQIRMINVNIDGHRQNDPTPIREAIADQIAQARGDQDRAAWFDHQGVALPTLSAARQEISRIQGEIATLEEQINQRQSQQSDLLDQAATAAAAAEQADGEQALDAFTQASNLRREAAEHAIQAGVLQSRLNLLEHELALVEQQHEVVTAAIEGFEQFLAQVDQGWQEIEQHLQNQVRLVQTVAEAGTGAEDDQPRSISQKVQRLSEILTRIEDHRNLAAEHLEQAARNYQDAAASAMIVEREMTARLNDPALRERPERPAWETVNRINNPALFQIRQAAANHSLAMLHAARAASLRDQLRLSESLSVAYEPARLALPQGLRPQDLSPQLQQALNEAETLYEQVYGLLDETAQSPRARGPIEQMLRPIRILVLYGWAQVSQQAGQEQQARQLLQQARGEYAAAREADVPLPRMPDELIQ